MLFTSYNPEVGQTDSTPCIAGGTGANVCQLAKNGLRPIALSQDLTAWSTARKHHQTFKSGEVVELRSIDYPDDSRCNGRFVVADAMNIRWTLRGDLFALHRSENTSCHADIYRTNVVANY